MGYTCVVKSQNTAASQYEKVESLPENTDCVVSTQQIKGAPSHFPNFNLDETSCAGFESESILPGNSEG